ncbi:MAG: BatD family protein [Candidatus Firestonebacteria bacterium]
MRIFSKTNSVFLFLIFFVSLIFGSNEPVSVNTTVSKNKITIGDKINFSLKIENNKNIELLPVDLSPYFKAFEIKDHSIIGPKKGWTKTTTEYKLVLTTWTTGTYIIPEISVKYKDRGSGTEKEIKSNKIYINVESVKPSSSDKDDIRDIKPPEKIGYPAVFYIVLALIPLIALSIYLLIRYLKNRNLSKIMKEIEPDRPPHEIAYERLKKLGELGLFKEGKIKEYYIILSEIIRSYLESRFKIPIIERTTLEAYKEMKESKKIKIKELSLIKDFLDESDLVKFAKYIPGEDMIKNDYAIALNIIDLTKDDFTSDVKSEEKE